MVTLGRLKVSKQLIVALGPVGNISQGHGISAKVPKKLRMPQESVSRWPKGRTVRLGQQRGKVPNVGAMGECRAQLEVPGEEARLHGGGLSLHHLGSSNHKQLRGWM